MNYAGPYDADFYAFKSGEGTWFDTAYMELSIWPDFNAYSANTKYKGSNENLELNKKGYWYVDGDRLATFNQNINLAGTDNQIKLPERIVQYVPANKFNSDGLHYWFETKSMSLEDYNNYIPRFNLENDFTSFDGA